MKWPLKCKLDNRQRLWILGRTFCRSHEEASQNDGISLDVNRNRNYRKYTDSWKIKNELFNENLSMKKSRRKLKLPQI